MKQPSMQSKKCPKCVRVMASITLDIDGAQRTLRSCSHCDIRLWESEDGKTTLDNVLQALAADSRS